MKMPSESRDLGLLILRVVVGALFLLHGLSKLLGGPDKWEGVAQHGLPFLPSGPVAAVFGLAAALAEFGGGALVVLGLWQRFACLALALTMAVAVTTKFADIGGVLGITAAGYPLVMLAAALALFFTGPGRYWAGRG